MVILERTPDSQLGLELAHPVAEASLTAAPVAEVMQVMNPEQSIQTERVAEGAGHLAVGQELGDETVTNPVISSSDQMQQPLADQVDQKYLINDVPLYEITTDETTLPQRRRERIKTSSLGRKVGVFISKIKRKAEGQQRTSPLIELINVPDKGFINSSTEPSNVEREQNLEPLLTQDTAMRKAADKVITKRGWLSTKTATRKFEASEDMRLYSSVRADSPMSIAYGVEVEHNPDGTWTGNEATFGTSIELCEALAEFMGNNAHTPEPVEMTPETSKVNNIIKGEVWLDVIARGKWPIVMMEDEPGGEADKDKIPASHDARETHLQLMMFLPKSVQDTITQVAKNELAIIAGEPKPAVPDNELLITTLGAARVGESVTYFDGADAIEDVTDDSALLGSVNELVCAPKGTLDKHVQSLRDELDIANSPIERLTQSTYLNGPLGLKNFLHRQTHSKNMTETELREAADSYITELQAHVLKIRGCN